MQVLERWMFRPGFHNWLKSITDEEVVSADINDVNAIRLTRKEVAREIKKGNIILRTNRKESIYE